MDKYLTIEDVTYLKQRMEANVPVNKIEKEKMLYFSKDNLNNLNVKVPLTKKRMCIGIAKHYIKIYQVFSSIVKTINPIYNWKDSTGASMSADVLNKKNIPSDANTTINKVNICNITDIHLEIKSFKDDDGPLFSNSIEHFIDSHASIMCRLGLHASPLEFKIILPFVSAIPTSILITTSNLIRGDRP